MFPEAPFNSSFTPPPPPVFADSIYFPLFLNPNLIPVVELTLQTVASGQPGCNFRATSQSPPIIHRRLFPAPGLPVPGLPAPGRPASGLPAPETWRGTPLQ
jgi:hypothetical protein